MATLYVENIPDELYEALREKARSNRRSISAETISILEQMIPTPAELKRRAAFYQKALRIRKRAVRGAPGPSAEALLRAERAR